MYTISMICSKQECRALDSWLSNHGYRCGTIISDDSNRELYIQCEQKTFDWFVSVFDEAKEQHDNITCTSLTQLIQVVQTIDSTPKYDCATAVDAIMEMQNKTALNKAYAACKKQTDKFIASQKGYSTITKLQNITLGENLDQTDDILNKDAHYQITVDNRNAALHAINNMKDYPVDITAEIEVSKGTLNAKEMETLDGSDIRELLGKKFNDLGTMYISEGALADVESWVNMQEPRKTQREWYDTPLDELEDIPF